MALGLAGTAQANNVVWSIGVHQPGIHVGVSNAPPVVVQYPVVVHSPRHVVVTQPPRHGWDAPGRRHGHDKWRDDRRHQKVTQVIHHHHYHGGRPVTIVQSAPPVRPHWR